MPITKNVRPYEFLARWCEITGMLKGYHFMNIEVVADGDEILAATPTPAMNVATARAAGFPIETILDKQSVAALEAFDAAHAEKDAAIAARDALAVEKAQAEAEMSTLLNAAVAAKRVAEEELASAQAQLAQVATEEPKP